MDKIKLRPYQDGVVTKLYNLWGKDENLNVMLQLPTGCLGFDTDVLMYDGSIKKVQDVVVGDMLMGPDSKPRNVLKLCRGSSQMYKVLPVKGEEWVCNDDHILSLQHTVNGNIIDISVKDYLKQNSTFKHVYKQYRTGVSFKNKKLEIDPYFIGLYLSEGTHSKSEITNPDSEVKEYLEDYIARLGLKIGITRRKGCDHFKISSFINKNYIRPFLKTFITKDDRFIPNDYKINSRENRLKLLAGLLDGDGHLHHNLYEIITKYENLKDDILFLCRSLGFAAYFSYKIGTIKSINFEGVYYRITISGDLDSIPCLIKRKQATKRKQKKSTLRTGISLTPLNRDKFYGFTLDGDNRFLLGDFTVTHNSGKSIIIAKLIQDLREEGHKIILQVHRKELVSQLSLALCKFGLVHNIIAPTNVARQIIGLQRLEFNKQFYHSNSPIIIGSVDTINARADRLVNVLNGIRYVITDEAAHVLKENKWGRALKLLPNTINIGFTATPHRLDKKGLGSETDGIYDKIVTGPTTRWLIDNKFLSKYKVVAPPSDFAERIEHVKTNTSDYSSEAIKNAAEGSQIVGDVVENYIKFANGTQAIVFAPTLTIGQEMADKFNAAGVTAKFLSSLDNDSERFMGVNDFKSNKIQVLLNVDLFDEGFDIGVAEGKRIIETVILARPTMSLGKYLQQVGRGLRPSPNKEYAIIIDHVGNVRRHGLPCKERKWSLDRPSKREKSKSMVRTCVECLSVYDRTETQCPFCGTLAITKSEGTGRVPPNFVDGDLELIDIETIREMEAKTVLESPDSVAQRVTAAAGIIAGKSAAKKQKERIETQNLLKDKIAQWAGELRANGMDDRSIHKEYFLRFDQTIAESLAEPNLQMKNMIEELDV